MFITPKNFKIKGNFQRKVVIGQYIPGRSKFVTGFLVYIITIHAQSKIMKTGMHAIFKFEL